MWKLSQQKLSAYIGIPNIKAIQDQRLDLCFMCIVIDKLTNQNSIQEENEDRLKSGNACYVSFGAELFVFQFAVQNLKIKIYRNIILPVVLYGCETCSLTLREERRLRVFENRMLRRIFGPKRDEVTGERRKLHYEELKDLYS
jgi:hypothetical protein